MTSEIWHEQCSVFFTWVRHGTPHDSRVDRDHH